MSIKRAVKLWILYYFLWSILLTDPFSLLGAGAGLSDTYSMYYSAMIMAIFHTVFKMKYGGFRGLLGPNQGILGHYSRVREERAQKTAELSRIEMERERERKNAARRYRTGLENGVLEYVNDEPDLSRVSHKFETSSADVINIIKKGINQGMISGNFKESDTLFISDNYIKNRIKEKMFVSRARDEQDRLVNSQESKVSTKQAGGIIIEPFISEDSKLLRTNNWSTYSPTMRNVGMKILDTATSVGLGIAVKRAGTHSILVDGQVVGKIVPYIISGVEWMLIGVSSRIDADDLDGPRYGDIVYINGEGFRFIKFRLEDWLKVEQKILSILGSIRDGYARVVRRNDYDPMLDTFLDRSHTIVEVEIEKRDAKEICNSLQLRIKSRRLQHLIKVSVVNDMCYLEKL